MIFRNLEVSEDLAFGSNIEIGITGSARGIKSTHYEYLTYAETEALISTLALLLDKLDEQEAKRQEP